MRSEACQTQNSHAGAHLRLEVPDLALGHQGRTCVHSSPGNFLKRCTLFDDRANLTDETDKAVVQPCDQERDKTHHTNQISPDEAT